MGVSKLPEQEVEKALASAEEREYFQAPVMVSGGMSSENCGLHFAMDLKPMDLEEQFTKIVDYHILFSLFSLVEVLLVIQQMDYTSTPSANSRVSLLTIGHQAVVDSYLTLIHLVRGILATPIFNSLATAAFLKFVLFAIFEMRYLLVIWKARHAQSFAGDFREAQREIGVLYTRFYMFQLAGILIFYRLNSQSINVFLFILYSFWVPQIINNVQRDSRHPLLHKYIIGTSLTRLYLPLYFLGCPHNFLNIPTDPTTLKFLVGWVVLQVLILITQDIVSPRFCIPKQFLPEKYNYRRPLNASTSTECVICMTTIEADDGEIMVTPCNHNFHGPCLQQWMDIKLECPTCRAMLPDL